MFKRISDHDGEERDRRRRSAGKSPRRADEQKAPEPERPTRLDEEVGTAVHELKDPPQAEG